MHALAAAVASPTSGLTRGWEVRSQCARRLPAGVSKQPLKLVTAPTGEGASYEERIVEKAS